MPVLDNVSNASDAIEAYGGTTSYKAGPGGHTDARKYAAEVQNDYAMAMLNAALEQAQWLRNVDYNDPANEYARLINAGVNPLLAMRGVAGDGSQASLTGTPSGSMSARAGSGSEQAAASRMANAINAAGSIGASAKDLADARYKNMQTEEMPKQFRTQQDLMQAESYLHRQNAQWVPRLAESSSNANDARAKYDSMNAGVAQEMKRLTGLQADYQKKELNWFQTNKVWQYEQMSSEIAKAYADVKSAMSQVKYYNSAAGAQNELASLYKSNTANAKLEAAGKRLYNMSQSTGIPLNILGGLMLSQMDIRKAFDQFGIWKGGQPFSQDNPLFQQYETWKQYDIDNAKSARDIGQRTATQFYWDRVLGTVNAAAGVAGAVSGVKNAFNPATRMFVNQGTNVNFTEPWTPNTSLKVGDIMYNK